MNEPSLWAACRDEYQRLQAQIASTPDEGLVALLHQSRSLAERLHLLEAETGVVPNRADLGAKATLVRERLRVGTIPVPADASTELRNEVGAFAARLLSPQLPEEFLNRLDQHTQDVQRASESLAVLDEHVSKLRQARDALQTLLTLLEALHPTKS